MRCRRVVNAGEIVDHRNRFVADRLLQVAHASRVNILSKVRSLTYNVAHGLLSAASTVVGQALGGRRRGGGAPSECWK
jgi:hypothetical protein